MCSLERRIPVNNKSLAIRGVVWTSASHVISIAMTFFVTPILLRTLGAEQYGIWSIVIALTGYYGLVNMGIGKANTKYIAQFDAVGDTKAVREVMSTGLAIFSLLAVVVLAVAGGVAWLFPYLFDLGDYPIPLARWIVMLTGLKVAVNLIGQVFAAGVGARKRFDLTNSLLCTRLILTGTLTILVVVSGGGLLGMALVVLGTAILFRAGICFLAIRVAGLPRPSLGGFNRDTGKMLFRFGLLNLVIQIVRRTSLVGGSLILGLFAGPVAVAYYSVAESLTRKSLSLGKTINYVVMPFASQFDAQSDRYALKRLMVLPTRLLLTLALLITAVLLILGKSFLTLWISPEIAANVYPVICILCLSLLVKLPTNGLQSTLTGMGRMTFLSRVAIGEGVTMLILGIILTPLYGTLGMASAVLISQLVFSGLLLPIYACRDIGYSMRRFALSTIGPGLLAVLPAMSAALVLAHYFPAPSLIVLLMQISLLCLLTGACAFFICLDASLRKDILRSAARLSSGRSTPMSTAVHDATK